MQQLNFWLAITRKMQPQYSPKNNPRVIIIQKLYGKFFNKEEELTFPKHRFKKFIKDVVIGTVERIEVINLEIKSIEQNFNLKNLDDIFKIIIQCATFEFLYKPNVSRKIIIKEYLNVSNFFLNDSQIKYLNAILDKLSKNL